MGNTLCKMSGEERRREMKKETNFECKSCKRTAKKKKRLCKPKKI